MTKINIFHDQIEKSMTFQAWKMISQNSMTFQVLHDPYEPCNKVKFDVSCYDSTFCQYTTYI